MKMFKKFLALTLALLLCSTAVFAVCAQDYGDNDTPNDWYGIKYTITVVANPTEGGTVTGGATVDEGSEVTITATANEGYEFAGWYLNGAEVSTDATYTVVADADKTYTAEFELIPVEYTITATATAGGTATGTATVVEGTEVTLTATANDGYKFVGWYDGDTKVADTATYTVVATADKTYTAKFEVAEVKYKGDVNGNGISGTDINILKNYIQNKLSAAQLAKFDIDAGDVNGNGVAGTDINILKNYIQNKLSAAQITKFNLPPKA